MKNYEKRKLRTNFEGLTDSDAETVLSDGLEHTENNPKLPVSAGSLADFKAKLATYIKSLRNVSTGGTIEVAIKNKDKKAVCDAATIVTQEINNIANGNVELLLSSGFPLAEEPTHTEIQAPATLSVKRTAVENQVILTVPNTKEFAQKGTVFAVKPSKEVQTDISKWTLHFTSAHRIVLEDVPAGESHDFAASYINYGVAKYKWSDIVTKK